MTGRPSAPPYSSRPLPRTPGLPGGSSGTPRGASTSSLPEPPTSPATPSPWSRSGTSRAWRRTASSASPSTSPDRLLATPPGGDMSARHITARPVPAVRTLAVVATVAALVLGAVVLGQRLVAGADAGAPGDAAAEPRELTFSTFLGGLEWDEATDVEVDDDGNRYVTGFTLSRDFPSARPEGPGGIQDAFVAKVAADNRLAWSVVLGGTELDVAYGLALDDDGNVYVAGRTG